MLEEHRYWVLVGYAKMLESAPPNGRYVHMLAQHLQYIKNSLHLEIDITKEREKQILKMLEEIFKE